MKESLNDGGLTSCYNPWMQQEIPDKSVADSIEALIGVCLLVGGRETAIHFLSNLGIGVYNVSLYVAFDISMIYDNIIR